MNNRMLNLGLVGAGRIGRVHAEHLQHQLANANLVIVADPNEAAARDCATRLQVAEHTTDFRRVTDHPKVEAVVICSPTDTHLEVILAAAAAGKHIFCEKPIDSELARIDRALAAVRKAQVVFQVGFNRRFDANFRRVRRAVVDGEIGTPHQLHIISRDPAPPSLAYIKQSGGIYTDMTIHDFDMARFLVGDEVVRLYATGAALVDPKIAEVGDLDTTTILLEFARGAVGVIENSRRAVYGYDQRAEVFGSGGAVRIDNNYPNTAILSGAKTVRRDLPLNFFMERYLASYLVEMEQFVEAVIRGGPSPLSGEEGRVPVVMALAARKSWELKRPVALTEVQ
jgi:myo-inositol 2-dehydrogenase/D-chiro-inositol 1-dehydrogenase